MVKNRGVPVIQPEMSSISTLRCVNVLAKQHKIQFNLFTSYVFTWSLFTLPNMVIHPWPPSWYLKPSGNWRHLAAWQANRLYPTELWKTVIVHEWSVRFIIGLQINQDFIIGKVTVNIVKLFKSDWIKCWSTFRLKYCHPLRRWKIKDEQGVKKRWQKSPQKIHGSHRG